MLPIILVAPHSQGSVPDEIKDRYALTDYEIWKCSDPYTDKLDEFTCTSSKHTANVSRLVCDLNRAPNTNNAFREFDFYGCEVFKDGQEFTAPEKENLLAKYWYPFHSDIIQSVQELDNGENEVILLVDYHNTSGDHALNDNNDYMPNMILSNLGPEIVDEKSRHQPTLSIPYEYVMDLMGFVEDELGISVEINTIYKGGYNLYWYTLLKEVLNTRAKIYGIQIEYNLDTVFNPISKTLDKKALEIMQNSLNKGLEFMYEELLQTHREQHDSFYLSKFMV